MIKNSARSLGLSGPRLIPAENHPIRPDQIHPQITEVISVLEEHGYIAWIVGGAVRDMLLGLAPKDYDVATDARPEDVKRCFREARIIGRRFRLVHLEFPGMTVEVATFRGKPRRPAGGIIQRDNTWGTPEEDAFRRDFTVNALAFDLGKFSIVDFVGGMPDVEAGVIRTIVAPEKSIQEDPARMLRAVRFSLRLGFKIDQDLAEAIYDLAPRLRLTKRHRLAEETRRFLVGGVAESLFSALAHRGLLAPLLGLEGFPLLFGDFDPKGLPKRLGPFLRALDSWSAAGREQVPPAVALLGMVVALASKEIRSAVLGGAAFRRDASESARRAWAALPHQLGEWGLLKGQVEPSMTILVALGMVLPEPLHQESGRRPPPGAKEAWMLLVLLGEVLKLEPALVARGKEAIAALPALPIPDHPPRLPHSSRGTRPRGRPGEKRGEVPATGEGRPRRPRRRRPQRPRGEG